MKLSTISATLAILASSVTAAPGLKPVEAREFSVYVTFNGADSDAYYTRSIPADGSVNILYDELSISSITSSGGATCSFTGQDGSRTVTAGAQTVPVGPPQTQVKATCDAL